MYRAKISGNSSAGQTTDTEIVQVLELCADQIAAALQEALAEIDGLSRSVLDTAKCAGTLCDVADGQRDANSVMDDPMTAQSHALQQAAQSATKRLQFADRLSQRLSNVSGNLTTLAALMRSVEFAMDVAEWTVLLKKMRATFTMEQERQMFDALFQETAALTGAVQAVPSPLDSPLFESDGGDD